MYQFVIRRVLLSLPTLLVVSFLIFGMIRLDPDSVVAARLGEGYDPNGQGAQDVKEEYGLDNPFYTEYVRWLGRIVTGDWGQSAVSFKPVLEDMAPKIAVTLELAVIAVLFAVAVGVPIGVLAAMRQDRWPDYVLRSFAILGLSIPGFYIATIVLAVAAYRLEWAPPLGYTDIYENPWANIQQMVLPAFILSLATSASVMRYARTMMLDVLRQDYIRTAWAKGLRERVVIVRHALKNALLPVITVIGLTMATLVGGTVIFETIFTLPGLGTYLLYSVQQRDFEPVQAVTLFFAIAVVVINLLVDLSYTVLDPRARR
ncbi:MAG: ABC transporter permease [Dehalococcoidia bacterium]|nr:ABC transporter permease [Dehalococcoidia bacterium]